MKQLMDQKYIIEIIKLKDLKQLEISGERHSWMATIQIL
jgi:hypothetical protein